VARELCPNPDVTHNIFAERCDCGGKVTHKGQVLTHAYDHVELPPIKPTTTRINLHSADLRGEPGSRAELSFRLPNLSR
jgi:transposase